MEKLQVAQGQLIVLVCSEKFVDGTTVALTAQPNSGSIFSEWQGDCTGTNPLCTVVTSADTVVEARFEMISQPGICGEVSRTSLCNEPLQSKKCFLGVPVEENFDTASKAWTWKCLSSGLTSELCTVKQSCDRKEVSP